MDKGFKMIAIQPLSGCADYIHKNLTIGKKYYLYKGYSINDDDSFQIDESEILPSTFFNESGISISISAVVGQNGSGKSNLIELLMRVVNNLSYSLFETKPSETKHELKPVFGVEAKVYYLINEELYCVYVNSSKRGLEFESLQFLGKESECYEGIEVLITKTTLSGERTSIIGKEEQCKMLEPSMFFYTLIINYSMYAYNVKDYQKEWVVMTGNSKGRIDGYLCWLDGLFHKNDGYKTPIVLNPFRADGIIDINNEKFLTYSRFVSLMVDEDAAKRLYTVNGNKTVEGIEISCGNIRDRLGRKIHSEIYRIIKDKLSENDRDLLSQINMPSVEGLYSGDSSVLNTSIYKAFRNNPLTSPLIDKFDKYGKYLLECWAENLSQNGTDNYPLKSNDPTLPYNDYIIIKTIKTSTVYRGILNTDLNWELILGARDETEVRSIIKDTVNKLYEDRSHITLKLRQSLIFKYWGRQFFNTINKYDVKTFNQVIQQTKEVLPYNNFLRCDVLNLLPPPIFDIEISLKDGEGSPFLFDNLSSGEKQFIFSISTILYHLKNIESAHQSDGNRTRYKHVNLILDEIELCYHPEMQRRQIKELIDAINNIKLSNIESINICLLTHSPIILSDIPHQNVLFLNSKGSKGEVTDITFGANIHSLYKHSFFMNLPMGEFAKNKIEVLFDKLRNSTAFSKAQLSDIKAEIQLIGEPLLRNQLMKLYYDKCNIEERISYLENELEELKKQSK
ncbi:MAG: ABC transporter ATP-binding protein [Anaerovoracaceae bacterium]